MTMDEKNEALDNLWYESWMFNKLSEYLIRPSADQIANNAYLESFLIHTRNIVDLLENQKYPSDVRCSDFGVREQVVNLPQGNSKCEINLWISHITKGRKIGNKPQWRFMEIRNEVNRCLKNFLCQITTDNRKPEFDFLD